MVLPLDRDPPARRLALVRWNDFVGRWIVMEAYRCFEGRSLESRLKSRSRPGDRILDVTGRKGSVEAAAAALVAPLDESGAFAPRQRSLFEE